MKTIYLSWRQSVMPRNEYCKHNFCHICSIEFINHLGINGITLMNQNKFLNEIAIAMCP